MRVLISSLLAVLGLSATGCWVEYDNSRRTPPPAQTTPQTPTPTPDPVRVTIDTGRALTVSPGGGAGLFITYDAGGNWKLSWTCDTSVNPRRTSPCVFDIAVGTHGIQELSVQPSNAVVQQDATSFSIRTSTTTTLDSATLRTEPGSSIAVTMRIDNNVYPSLIWYVSDGKLTTAPSDPIELVPSTP
jgi:hypothetical protein